MTKAVWIPNPAEIDAMRQGIGTQHGWDAEMSQQFLDGLLAKLNMGASVVGLLRGYLGEGGADLASEKEAAIRQFFGDLFELALVDATFPEEVNLPITLTMTVDQERGIAISRRRGGGGGGYSKQGRLVIHYSTPEGSERVTGDNIVALAAGFGVELPVGIPGSTQKSQPENLLENVSRMVGLVPEDHILTITATPGHRGNGTSVRLYNTLTAADTPHYRLPSQMELTLDGSGMSCVIGKQRWNRSKAGESLLEGWKPSSSKAGEKPSKSS